MLKGLKRLKFNLSSRHILHRIRRQRKRAKNLLNHVMGQCADYDVVKNCNRVCQNLYKFDNKQIQYQIKRFGSSPVKTLKGLTTRLFTDKYNQAHDNLDQEYMFLITTEMIVAGFMDRYDLGIIDLSKRARNHFYQLQSNQNVYDPNESLDDFFFKDYRLFSLGQAGMTMRKLFPNCDV